MTNIRFNLVLELELLTYVMYFFLFVLVLILTTTLIVLTRKVSFFISYQKYPPKQRFWVWYFSSWIKMFCFVFVSL